MLNLLFVDDDHMELHALCGAFDWDQLDIRVIGCAHSGAEALRICESAVPDLVVTDLLMPSMNGLQLAKALRDRFADVHIIIVSGFEDFESARNAIEVQLDGYLLKPLNTTELLDLIQKISGLELARRIRKGEDDRLNKLVSAAQPLLKERFWLDVLQGGDSAGEAALFARAQFIGIPIRQQHYVVVLVKFHNGLDAANSELSLSRQGILAEVCSPLTPYVSVRLSALLYGIIMPFSKIVTEDIIIGSVESLADALFAAQRGADQPLSSLGASLPGTINQMPALYDQAQQALSARFRLGHGRLYWYEDDPKNDPEAVPDSRALLRRIDEALMSADAARIAQLTNELFDMLHYMPQEGVQSICIELTSCAMNHAARHQISLEDVFGPNVHPLKKLMNMDTILDIQQWMCNILTGFALARAAQHNSAGKAVVDQVLAIIEREYMDDLSVATFAARVHLAQGYMCRVFKNHTGKNIMAVLLDRRMQQAKLLLSEPNWRVSEVAQAVGFSSVSYFSKVFRDYVGITPSEYNP